MEDKTLQELKKSSVKFREALSFANTLSADELFRCFNRIKYEAHGFPAIMIYRIERDANYDSYWEANLRNDVNWQEPKVECKGYAAKGAMALMYAWCIHKGYLSYEEMNIYRLEKRVSSLFYFVIKLVAVIWALDYMLAGGIVAPIWYLIAILPLLISILLAYVYAAKAAKGRLVTEESERTKK